MMHHDHLQSGIPNIPGILGCLTRTVRKLAESWDSLYYKILQIQHDKAMVAPSSSTRQSNMAMEILWNHLPRDDFHWFSHSPFVHRDFSASHVWVPLGSHINWIKLPITAVKHTTSGVIISDLVAGTVWRNPGIPSWEKPKRKVIFRLGNREFLSCRIKAAR